jgi:glycosyltransferase involved in cell wall biosynthesis
MSDDLAVTPEFQAYLRARDAVLQMKGGSAVGQGFSPVDPSPYWAEELENIDYMIDASPLIVRKLRHHAFHITGSRPYDYREKGDGRREHFSARLEALRALGRDGLLLPEAQALGGFGYDVGGQLFNVDTLKFSEVLVGMERGGVLDAVRRTERPVVCEIGAGWGGFAYQFKTLFPRARYVIVDFPELFLFSATYLGVLFPEARLLFCGTRATPALDGWNDADVVFVPHTMAALVSTLPLDLTVNMVSFQEMTDEQVRGYARIAADAGCPLLYSLNRERSPYNSELVSVSQALETRYQLTEVPVLDSDYTSAMKKRPKAGRLAERSELGYRHLVGRLDRSATFRPAAGAPSVGHETSAPRVVLGMTLYNNARHLREAMESLLSQTFADFRLFLLDDGSADETEAIAREYTETDPRVVYRRHSSRQAMIATWREVADMAMGECPSTPYFAWVSDHDRWHPRWLERLVADLDADPGAVLAYPITRRMTHEGQELDKGPRLFDTASQADLRERWALFCAEGVGAGDMVYGLMRVDALRRAGVFRTVLRPDRLLIAELTLYGRIRQVPEVLWYRRQSSATSVERQRHTLVLPGDEPKWFSTPPWWQHTVTLWREYALADPPPLPLSRAEWRRMLLRYQLTYGWRHFRKSDTSHGINATINQVVWTRKRLRHHYHHAVYNTLVGARALWGRTRRAGRRTLYEVLMFTHRAGLRGPRS